MGSDNHFVKLPFWLIDTGHLKILSPSEWVVLTVFARYAYFGNETNEKGCCHGETFISRKTISEATGMSIATIDRLIRGLVNKGYLMIRHRGKYKVIRSVVFMTQDGLI